MLHQTPVILTQVFRFPGNLPICRSVTLQQVVIENQWIQRRGEKHVPPALQAMKLIKHLQNTLFFSRRPALGWDAAAEFACSHQGHTGLQPRLGTHLPSHVWAKEPEVLTQCKKCQAFSIPSKGNGGVSTILPTPGLHRGSSGLENPITTR